MQFSSAGSLDPDPGDTIRYQWTFGDGATSTAANPSHTYTVNGNYTANGNNYTAGQPIEWWKNSVARICAPFTTLMIP